jgi:hypothetical protein
LSTQAPTRSASWVFWSSRESIDSDVVSIMAVFETLVSVPAFWLISTHYSTFLPLLTSIIAAPIVLLRSDESVELGVRWFERWVVSVWYDIRGVTDSPAARRLIIRTIAVVSIIIGGMLAYTVGKHDLSGISGWSAFWRAFLVTPLTLVATGAANAAFVGSAVDTGLYAGWTGSPTNAETTVAVLQDVALFEGGRGIKSWDDWWGGQYSAALTEVQAERGAGPIAIWTSAINLRRRSVSIALAAMIGFWLSGASMASVAAAGIVATAGAIGRLYRVMIRPIYVGAGGQRPDRIISLVINSLVFLPIAVGIGIGIFLVSVTVRVGATFYHLRNGLRTLPRNFRRLTLCTSPLHTPELVPGLGEGTSFTVKDWLRNFQEAHASLDATDVLVSYTIVPLIVMVWFLPAWLYRITLKSTVWFWWPLTFLGSPLQRAQDPNLFRRLELNSLRGQAGIVLSLAAIIWFITDNFVMTGTVFHPNPFVSLVGYLFLVNWNGPVWQYVTLSVPILTIVIVLSLNEAGIIHNYGITEHKPELIARASRRFSWIERLTRLRLLLTICFWLLAGGQMLLAFNAKQCWFTPPAKVQMYAVWLYGTVHAPPPCSAQYLPFFEKN